MVAQLAADEVSALVGYPIAPADLNWKGRQLDTDDLGLAVASTPRQTMETVAGLSGRDMRRRDLLQEGGGLFAAAAFADPVLASLTGVVELIQRDSAAPQTPTAAMTRQMTATFRQLDAKYGSATIRPQVVAFLHDRTKLAVSARPDADVFGALSELTQFAAWLSQDCGKHGTAQRY
nr:hypothetical protein [Micromonospora sp. DSM 115978]